MKLKIEITKRGIFNYWANIYVDENYIKNGNGATEKRAIIDAFKRWGKEKAKATSPSKTIEFN